MCNLAWRAAGGPAKSDILVMTRKLVNQDYQTLTISLLIAGLIKQSIIILSTAHPSGNHVTPDCGAVTAMGTVRVTVAALLRYTSNCGVAATNISGGQGRNRATTVLNCPRNLSTSNTREQCHLFFIIFRVDIGEN